MCPDRKKMTTTDGHVYEEDSSNDEDRWSLPAPLGWAGQPSCAAAGADIGLGCVPYTPNSGLSGASGVSKSVKSLKLSP